MPFQLIFEADARHHGKDIHFLAAYPGMVLPVVHFALDSGFVPSCSDLFTVCD